MRQTHRINRISLHMEWNTSVWLIGDPENCSMNNDIRSHYIAEEKLAACRNGKNLENSKRPFHSRWLLDGSRRSSAVGWTVFFRCVLATRSTWLNFKCNSSTAEPFGSSYHTHTNSFAHFVAHFVYYFVRYFTKYLPWMVLYVPMKWNDSSECFAHIFFYSFKLSDFDSFFLFHLIVYKWEFQACKE